MSTVWNGKNAKATARAANQPGLRRGLSGRITTPLGVQPWGSYYGKLTDKFGVQWMLNCTG